MKAIAINAYFDKVTGEPILSGMVIEVEQDRFEEINGTHHGIFLEIMPENQNESEPKESETDFEENQVESESESYENLDGDKEERPATRKRRSQTKDEAGN